MYRMFYLYLFCFLTFDMSGNEWLIVALGWWFGFLGFSYERECYLRAPLEFQTTGPQTTIYH